MLRPVDSPSKPERESEAKDTTHFSRQGMGTLKAEESSKFAPPGLAATGSADQPKRPMFTNTKKPVEDVTIKRGDLGT